MLKRKNFPDGFIFGVATSSYQIEGHQFGGAGLTIWDKFAREGGTINNESGHKACEHFFHHPQDLDLICNGGFDAYRFSMSWARIMPDGKTINNQGIDFYDKLIDEMLVRGLKPFATAYHWELPLALGEQGGWMMRDTALRFGDYMGLLAQQYGDRLETLASINEPWCVAWLSHFLGHHAPGLRDIKSAARAMHHILLAHGLGVNAARNETKIPLGAVLNFEPGYAVSNQQQDIDAAMRHNAIYNEWFISAIMCGEYPKICLDGFGQHLPENWQSDMAVIEQPIDFMGINYYTRKLITAASGEFPNLKEVEGALPKTDMGWEISPDSFSDVIDFVAKYTKDLPLYITENGMASTNQIDDGDRINYFNQHLEVVTKSSKKYPLKGYFAWSLMDNFEWAFGYEKRFGLLHVDYENQIRTPKKSFGWWKNLLDVAN